MANELQRLRAAAKFARAEFRAQPKAGGRRPARTRADARRYLHLLDGPGVALPVRKRFRAYASPHHTGGRP